MTWTQNKFVRVVKTLKMFEFGSWEDATSGKSKMPTTAKWVDRAKKDDTGKTFVRCRLVARDFKHSPCSHCCRSSSSWSAFVRFVPFSAALSWYSFMRLVAACAFAVPFSSSSIRLRQLSVCACLAVPRSNDMHPGHLAVNPNSSKFSREKCTLASGLGHVILPPTFPCTPYPSL